MTDFETFIADNSDVIFRMLSYRKVYTPYETYKKFMDESIYEDGGYYKYVKIKQAIEIPNDILLKLLEIDLESSEDTEEYYIYKRLSDIQLIECPSDIKRMED